MKSKKKGGKMLKLTVVRNVKMTEAMFEQLKREAEAEMLTVSDIMRRALAQYLAKKEPSK